MQWHACRGRGEIDGRGTRDPGAAHPAVARHTQRGATHLVWPAHTSEMFAAHRVDGLCRADLGVGGAVGVKWSAEALREGLGPAGRAHLEERGARRRRGVKRAFGVWEHVRDVVPRSFGCAGAERVCGCG
ncbi:hypothetical protein GCM10023215_42570 [Pseudonocardia yuanmonensis]|uniref:Uncharacterized protein n=1 Tax=Pseudonocardia yuanmonensis TaxID=1095914 RepID=A0ABP8X696_9PSEU